jgi:hypothetical protein
MKRLIAISILLLTVAANAQNLNFKIAPVQDSASTAAWTSATTLNTVLKVTVTNRSSVSVYYSPSGGSVTGGVIAFQRSQDDSIYSPVFCTGVDGTNNGTQFTLGASAQEWTCAVGSATKFQVKLSTQVAGVGTANVSVTASSSAPGSAATIVASSALPTGAATETTLAAMNAKIPASPATDRSTAAAPFATRLSDGAAFYKATTPADTQPISAAALPLPTGAATETTIAAMNTKIPASPATDRATAAAPGAVRLSNGAAFITPTTPTDTQPISAAALPLPVGAATETTLAAMNTKIPASPATDRATAAAPGAVRLTDGTTFYKGTTPADTQPISAAALPLPSGAATETTLAAMNTKIPASPATDRSTAGAPFSTRLTDGTSFYKATTPADTQPVSIAANVATTDAATSATGSAPPAKASFNGNLGSGLTGGLLAGVTVGDTYKNINVSTATTTLLVTGVAGRQVRITALHMVTAAANNVALIEGTGATCGTGTAGMAGGTTAATGYNFSANGGMTEGAGLGTVMQTATAGDSVCIVTSAATQLSGGLQYAIY